MTHSIEAGHTPGEEHEAESIGESSCPDASAYLSASELRARGWTDRLIRMFLVTPDRTVPNPRRYGGRPMRLYRLDRVIVIEEGNAEFASQRSRSDSYSTRIKVKTAEKTAHLEALVRAIPIPDLTLPFAAVLDQAAEKQKGSAFFASQPILRVALEVLLDTMKSLDWHLDDFMWHSGIRDARKLLRRRMLAHIIDHYPELAEVAKERVTEEDGSTERW